MILKGGTPMLSPCLDCEYLPSSFPSSCYSLSSSYVFLAQTQVQAQVQGQTEPDGRGKGCDPVRSGGGGEGGLCGNAKSG